MRAGWTELAFEDACLDVSSHGGKVSKGNWLPDGAIPIIDQGDSLVAGYSDDPSLQFRGHLPVIVFGDHTRRFKYVDHPFVIGADGVKVIAATALLDARFLYWFLSSVNVPSAGYSRHYKFLKDLRVPVPPLDEQQRIACLLDRAAALRASRTRYILLLDELRQASFATFLERHSSQVGPLGDVLATPLGNGISPATGGTYEGAVLTLGAVRNLDLNPRAQKPCLFAKRPADRQMVTRGMFLVSRGNGNLNLVGRGVVVGRDLPGVAFPDTVIGARIDEQRVTPEYLSSTWASKAVRDQIERVATTTNGTFKINQTNLSEVMIPILGLREQARYSQGVRRTAVQRARVCLHLCRLESLFASLQHRAFAGQL